METVIYGILKEEKARNLEMQEAHLREIMLLPKGTIVTKDISGNDYYYLKYRQNNKIKTDYLGKDRKKVELVCRGIEKRKHLQTVLKRLKVEYKQICKIVKD
ncbi:MAG: hypothetical protein LBI42_01200 [Chitinispirillales bacterium]|jgi:hypothetical protein|nr:hypothetical protein [Chitinispirillales bacterium]